MKAMVYSVTAFLAAVFGFWDMAETRKLTEERMLALRRSNFRATPGSIRENITRYKLLQSLPKVLRKKQLILSVLKMFCLVALILEVLILQRGASL